MSSNLPGLPDLSGLLGQDEGAEKDRRSAK